MSLGGPKNTTQTTQVQLSPEQQALISPVIPIAENFLANSPVLPNFSTTAGFDPAQTAAQNQLLSGVAPQQQQLANGAANTSNFLLNDVLFPESNPALQATIEAATRPIQQNFLETILPGIRGEAQSSGQFGGSRQGIAEGIAARGTQDAIGSTAAGIANQGFQTGLDAVTRNLALLPQTLASLGQPALTTGAVGDVRQAQTQAQLDEASFRDLFSQIGPFLAAQEVAALGAGIPGGTTVATGTAPSPNPLTSALGGASLGAALGGTTATGLGGVLGLLSAFL